MNKKISLYLLFIITCFSLTGCVETSDNAKEVKNVEPPIIESIKTSKANIKKTVIVDRDNIKITAKSINYDGWMGPEIQLLIENNSSQDITVQARDFSINGIMLDPSLSADVAAGKKSNDSISVFTSELNTTKITSIKNIEFALNVFNSDSWNEVFIEKGIKLETDAINYIQVYNTDGTLVVDKNNIKIYVLKLDDKDSFWGADIYVYIENNSSQNLTVQARDVSINGFMVDPSFSSNVIAGKKVYDSITFFESDLEENDIKEITELELKFIAFNVDSWKNIFETISIKISF